MTSRFTSVYNKILHWCNTLHVGKYNVINAPGYSPDLPTYLSPNTTAGTHTNTPPIFVVAANRTWEITFFIFLFFYFDGLVNLRILNAWIIHHISWESSHLGKLFIIDFITIIITSNKCSKNFLLIPLDKTKGKNDGSSI